MSERLRYWIRIAAVNSICFCAAVCHADGGTQLSVHFAHVSSEKLVRRLQQLPISPPEGLQLDRQYRFLGGPGTLAVSSKLTNASQRPMKISKATVTDWIFAERDASDAECTPLTYRTDTWYGSTYWTGPNWTRVGKDWHHPGSQTSSIRRFLIPRDGQVVIRGRVYKADTNGGDGVRLEIRHGARTRWQAVIASDDQEGVEPDLTLQVRRGEAIRFIVHRRGTIGYDTTHWDPVITYADGTVFRASQSFTAQRQGAGGWYYEMESDADTIHSRRGPNLHAFRNTLQPVTATVGSAETISLTPSDALPVWIIADELDASGIVVALNPSQTWKLHCNPDSSRGFRFQLAMTTQDLVLSPGESLQLPHVWLSSYEGHWINGTTVIQELVSVVPDIAEMAPFRNLLRGAAQRAGIVGPGTPSAELDLITLVHLDWQQQDQLQETIDSYRQSTGAQIDKADQLLNALHTEYAIDIHQEAADELDRLQATSQRDGLALSDWRLLYVQSRWLKRRIALANPLLDFGPLLICKRVPTSYSHLVMQYFGWRARPGGGIFILERPGHSLRCHDILNGKLAGGNVLEPRLSYDGTHIAFSYVRCREDGRPWNPVDVDNEADDGFYHLWTVNIDGSDLQRITHGPYEDLMPCWLPDGGIAFSSTRRRGYARCFGAQFSQRWHVYTLHRVEQDGTEMRLLSAHDTNEWFPTVSNTGHILYSRWDYIDRDAVTHQNLWAMHPDGSNPIAVWGNATNSPHCTFQPQPIPDSNQVVFTASAHHSITGGSIAILDPSVGNNGPAAITRLTPEIPFPEAESRNIGEYYAAPWPLSEKYFLVAYSPQPLVWEPGANAPDALGICLLDKEGNRELIYRDPEIGSTNPCPLVPRPAPPIISSLLPAEAPDRGEMLLTNIYEGLGDIPPGTIKQLRVIQIFPKTTPVADAPRVGLAREENARAILGTVPVHPDGSARFYVPAMKPLLFQALDENGMAYQTMRTITYVQPGERISCYGCHESRHSTRPNRPASAMQTQNAPAEIDPGELGGRPFSFVEVVQPILDRHCIHCHHPEKKEAGIDLIGTAHDGFTQSYWSLCGDRDFWGTGTNPTNAAEALVPRFGGRNQIERTPPGGQYGARGSRLIRLLRLGHHDVRLAPRELRNLAAWIDCNAIFYGAYRPELQERQLRGERLPMPVIQ